MEGYVYILTNPAMPGLVKVGLTENIKARLASLYTSGVPAPFNVEFTAHVKDMESVESMIHSSLSQFRYNKSREFFSTSASYAIEVAKLIVEDIRNQERDEYFDRFYSVWDCPIEHDELKFP